MSASDRAAELRALADQHDELGGLEDALAEAVEAYRDDPTEENREAYTEASEALREARKNMRSSLLIGSVEPGSVTIGGAGIGTTTTMREV
jgi:hypothetical protein